MAQNPLKDYKQKVFNPKKDWKKWLYYRWIVKNIPFFLFAAMLAVLYIANGHYADKNIRKINATSKKLKEMEYVEKIAEKINNISVSGNGMLIEQLKQIFVAQK